MAKRSYYQRKSDEVSDTIHRAKRLHNLTDQALAKKIGMSYSDFSKKKNEPGRLRAEQIWAIEKLAEEVS